MNSTASKQFHQRFNTQSGAALVTALMFLVILTMLALSSMTSTTLDEKMAANSVEMNRVFQAAETGLSMAMNDARSFITGNTETSPHEVDNIAIGALTIEYRSVYRQQTIPPRQSGFEAGTAAAYHFDLKSEAASPASATTTLNQGAYQIGPKD